jgi:proline iminopeptidase
MPQRFPDIEPYATGMLSVGDGHEIYWETVGNPDGLPAVYLHGGPGSGSSIGARRSFDPERYSAVIFDQRGAGRSRPLASDPDADLSTNTTAHLIDDLERLREHLGIERWVVVGGSWGVTLALVYAEQHPQRVIALVLAAVTAGTSREIDWMTRDMRRIFPREWYDFISLVPEVRLEGNVPAAYLRLLMSDDEDTRERAARAWCTWEDVHVSLAPGSAPSLRYEDAPFRLRFARLVTHYWANGCFLQPGQLLRDLPRIAHIPAVLIHGRLDVSGPLDTAWDLHRNWPASTLVVLDDTGHGGSSMTDELVNALSAFATAGD